MARDGSGNYNLPAGNPVVTGTVISSTQFNSTMTDIATAITQSIAKDGQTTPTGNLPMGGNKHTGVADGNLGNQYASINQTQNGSLNKLTAVANVVDAYTGSLTPAISGYTDGQVVTFIPSVTSTTTSPTIAINGLAAKPINKEAGVACVAGDIVINVPAYLVYYATGGYFLLLNPQKITGTRLSSPVVIPTPAAGTALTVSNVAGSPVAHFTSVNTSTSDIEVFRSSSTANLVGAGANLVLQDSGATTATMLQHAGGQTELWQFNGSWSQIFKVTSARGIVLNAPSSGTTLSIGQISGQNAVTINDGTISQSWGNNGSIGYIGTNTAHSFEIVTAATPRFVVNSAGNATLNAPSSGNSLTATSVAGSNALFAVAPNTASNSYGITVQAGTNSTDRGLMVVNAANTAIQFLVRGDGIVQATDQSNTLQDVGWRGTPVNLQSGNYTLVLADRGRLVGETTASNTITVPANVFSAGDVVTIGAGITSGSITIAQGASLVMNWANGSNTTGNRTLAGVGIATVVFISPTACWITGTSLS
jgi:hypothetical protein